VRSITARFFSPNASWKLPLANAGDRVATVSFSCCTVCPDLATTKMPFGKKEFVRMSLISQAFLTSMGVPDR